MNNKNEATKSRSKQILRDGILDMSVERLIQISQFGLMGIIILSNKTVFVKNVFNRISYNQESDAITFSTNETLTMFSAKDKKSQSISYGVISFSVGAITEISGCEDEEYPDKYLNINIKLEDGTDIKVKIFY